MDYNILCQTALFRGLTAYEVFETASALGIYSRQYTKEQFIFHAGDRVTELGIVVSGGVRMENVDMMGNRSIIGVSTAGDIFAEAYACIPNEPLGVDVVSTQDSEILFLNVSNLFKQNSDRTPGINILLRNLLMISSRKNMNLSSRIFCTSPKTIRERLICYFSQEVKKQGSHQITLPFDRQQMADYLNLDRSALSKELGRMRDEGLIDFRKNQFSIKL